MLLLKFYLTEIDYAHIEPQIRWRLWRFSLSLFLYFLICLFVAVWFVWNRLVFLPLRWRLYCIATLNIGYVLILWVYLFNFLSTLITFFSIFNSLAIYHIDDSFIKISLLNIFTLNFLFQLIKSCPKRFFQDWSRTTFFYKLTHPLICTLFWAFIDNWFLMANFLSVLNF